MVLSCVHTSTSNQIYNIFNKIYCIRQRTLRALLIVSSNTKQQITLMLVLHNCYFANIFVRVFLLIISKLYDVIYVNLMIQVNKKKKKTQHNTTTR